MTQQGTKYIFKDRRVEESLWIHKQSWSTKMVFVFVNTIALSLALQRKGIMGKNDENHFYYEFQAFDTKIMKASFLRH